MPDAFGHSSAPLTDNSNTGTVVSAPVVNPDGVDLSTAAVRQPPSSPRMNTDETAGILLITDDNIFGQQVTFALERLGYPVSMLYTSDPSAAILRCASERPALVMLNVDALSLGGIGLSRRLKADVPGLKVLALVHGHELEAAKQEASISGADAVCGLLDVPLSLGTVVQDLYQRSAADSEKAPTEPSLTLQDRIRAEASAFDFTALLDGVSTDSADKGPIQNVSDESGYDWLDAPDPEPSQDAAPTRRNRRRLRPAFYALMCITAVVVPLLLLNSGVLQSAGGASSGSAVPAKPDINSTVRKGLPFPPLTPGERVATPRLEAPISEEARAAVFAAYGLAPEDAQSYVLVRLIPSGLGGTENAANLFPTTPWFADLKSRLDKRLLQLVRSGKVTVQQAEAELKDNWVRASHRFYIRNYGIENPEKARAKEDELKWD